MDNIELAMWLGSMAVGDKVGVYQLHGKQFVYETTVVKRTPSGRIVCSGNATFSADGNIYGASAPCYRDRCLRPLPQSQPRTGNHRSPFGMGA